MKQGSRLSRKESEGRLVSAWLGATAVALPAGIGMLYMALPVGLVGASLIGGWFTFAGALGLVTMAGLMTQAYERSPGGNFKAKPFFKGMAASALVCGGILGGMTIPVRQAFNERAGYLQSLGHKPPLVRSLPDHAQAAPVQKP